MAFPTNLQFVPIKVGGAVPTAAAGNVDPESVDIVGDAQFPPAYYAYDGQNAYFRLRLRGDPRSKTSFQNFVWGLLIDTNNQQPLAYEWELSVTGGSSQINLIPNRIQGPDPLRDPPEGTDGKGYPNFFRPINNFDLARARLTDDGSSFGGAPNYFFDFFLDTGTLFSQLVINASTPLRFLFFTATTTQVFNKDSLPFSDVLTFNQANVRAALQAQETLVSPAAAVLAGEVVTATAALTVSNTGSSGASSVFATVPFAADQLANFQIVGVTAGNAVFNAATQTLSWNVGNLANGQSATLTAAADVVFASAGLRTLDTFAFTGIDQFTGNMLPSASGSQTIAVLATGSVTGVVQDASNGLPLPGVAAQLLELPGKTAVTGDGGAYGITSIAPGAYMLQLSLAGFATQQLAVVIQAGQALTVNARLSPLPAALSGVVTSAADGAPVAGATLRVDDPAGVTVATTATGPAGQYAVSGIPAGKLQLTLSAEGFQLLSAIVQLAPAETRVLDLALAPSLGSLTGLVANAAGQPVAGAVVTLLNEQVGTLVEATTDANGRYTLDALVPGTVYLLKAQAPGFALATATARVLPGIQSVANFTLTELPGSLTGIVREEGVGEPLAGVAIRITDRNGVTLDIAQTDDAGLFVFEALPPDLYAVLFNGTGFANRSVSVTIHAGAETALDIGLTRLTGSIAGKVLDPAGAPIAEAAVAVTLNSTVVVGDVTDGEGMFFIASLFPENYIVTAEAPGFAMQSLGVLIEPLQVASLTFTLAPLAGSIVGAVTDPAGAPLSGAVVRVLINLLASTTMVTQTLTDENGIYSISGLAPGSYILTVSLMSFQNALSIVEVHPAQETTESFKLTPNPGFIEGMVLNDQGEPIAGVTVSVEIANSTGAVVSAVFAGLDGAYRSGELAPGFYSVFAFAAGYRSDLATRSVTAGETAVARILLQPLPGSVQGSITDALTGEAVAGATVKAVTQSGVALDSTLSDNDGFYRMNGLRPGGYSIIATAPTYEYLIVGAVVLADTVTQTDLALSQLTGDVAGAVDPVVDNVLIQLYTLRNVLIDNTYTDASGSYRFAGLRAGSYVLSADADNYSSDPVGVTIAPGQTTPATIRLRPNPGSIEGTVADDQGQPIATATVLVLDRNETIRGTGHTGQFGMYFVGNLPTGTLSVVASAPGFANAISAVQMLPGSELTGIDFALTANPGGISGLVTDAASGALIAGAEVEVRQSDASGLTVAVATTGEFGDFRIEDLRPTSYSVLVYAAGYATNAVGAIVQSGVVTSASIGLVRLTGSIVGNVLVPGGSPLGSNGISLKLFTSSGGLVYSLFADSDGSFRIDGLEPGTYVISITALGFVTASQTVYVTAGRESGVTLRLTPELVAIAGAVVDAENGAPIAGALIGLHGHNGFPIETTLSDKYGRFAFGSLPVGRLTLSASAIGFGSKSAAIETEPGVDLDLVFALDPRTGDVVGFVTALDDGTPLAGAEIRLYNRNQTVLVTVLSDNSGAYSFNQLARGSYFALAALNGYATSQGGFSIVSDQTTKYSFALQPLPGALVGRLTDAATGQPLAGGIVVLRPYNNFAAPLGLTSADSGGVYELRDLPAGNYVINVTAAGFEALQSSVFVGRGERARQDFALRASAANVKGAVTDASTGQPVTDALVTVIDGNGVIVGQDVTDADGRYLASTGPEGAHHVVAVSPGFQFGETDAVLAPDEQATLNVKLPPHPSTVRGITRNAATGSPISGVVLTVLTAGLVPIETLASDGEGAFAFASLAPGTYTVTATAPSYASTAQEVIAVGDATVVLDLELPPMFGTLTGTIRDADGRPLRLALAEAFLIRMMNGAAKERAAVSAVRASSQAQAMIGIFMRSIISDAAGRYTLSNLPPGNLRALFSFPGKQPALREPVIAADRTTVLDIVLEDEEEE